jgi:hypothetical protein
LPKRLITVVGDYNTNLCVALRIPELPPTLNTTRLVRETQQSLNRRFLR